MIFSFFSMRKLRCKQNEKWKKKAEIRIFYHNGTCICRIQLHAQNDDKYLLQHLQRALVPEGLMLAFIMKIAVKSINLPDG